MGEDIVKEMTFGSRARRKTNNIGIEDEDPFAPKPEPRKSELRAAYTARNEPRKSELRPA